MPGGERIWTFLLLRGGGGRVFEWRGSRLVAAGLAAGVLLATLAAGAALGVAWGEHREDRRTTELREQVRELRQERERVRRLAARLDSMERGYRRIRRIMTAGSGASEGDVHLPGVPEEESGEAGPAVPPAAGAADVEWIWPLSREGFVTRAHREGGSGGSREHSGMDIAVPVGSYVRAARPGTVETADEDPVYGLFVRLRHTGGYRSLYGHNRWLFVRDGDSVAQGEVIALSGSSGRSTAPHLHFEVTGEEGSVDPQSLLGGGAPGAAPPTEETGGDGS